MNGSQAVLRHCRRPYGIVRKTITFPGRSLISVDVIAWKSNPWRPLRHGVDRMATKTLSPKRTKARQRGQRIVYRGKRRLARRTESKTGGGGSISSAGDSGENRPKSACGSVCTLRFRVRKRLRCLRAVGLRPVPAFSRMRFYAPYAVPLKGKGRKKVQLPKEVHKAHTSLCMSSQPY